MTQRQHHDAQSGQGAWMVDAADDLRSPIGSIESIVQQLAATRAPVEQDALILALQAAAAHLRSVTSAVLKPEGYCAAPADLGDCLTAFGIAAKSRCAVQGIAFRREIAPGLEGLTVPDATAVRQMLEGLLDHALQRANGRGLVFRVELRALGGAEAVECAMFDGAAQPAADDVTLARLRRVAARLGGASGIAMLAEGARVFFTVPVDRTASVPPAVVQPDPELPVLVVDTDDAGRQLLATVLGHLGHRIEFAATATDARALLQDRTYAAVFVDHAMRDGTQPLIGALRASGVEVPIVALCARLTPATAGTLISGGASTVLEKPCTVHDLRQALVSIGLRDAMQRQVRAA